MSERSEWLYNELPDYAQKYVTGAFAGDVGEATSLLSAAPNSLRPCVLGALYHDNVRPTVIRAVLRNAWGHDHQYLIGYFSRNILREIFNCAGTKLDNLPPKVTLYRGGKGPLASLRRGWSWTTDRRIACWFATTWRVNNARDGEPLVISATISSCRVVHVDDKIEAEMIIYGARNAAVDGTPDEWKTIGSEYNDEKNAAQRFGLNAL